MKRWSPVVTVLVFAVVIASIPAESDACYACLRSPSNWGFCRPGFDRGHGDCQTIVVDSFHGTTDCSISMWGTCYHGGTNYTGCTACSEGPLHYTEANPCSWTDTDVSRVV